MSEFFLQRLRKMGSVPKRRTKFVKISLCVAGCLIAARAGFFAPLWIDPALGATGNQSEDGATYTVVDQDLRDLLVEVGGQLGFRVNLSDGVRGRVRGRLPGNSPEQVIDYLARLYSLDRYANGSVLYVSAKTEITNKVFDLGPLPLGDLRATLDGLGLSDERWPLRQAGGTELAAMSAPPSYIDIVDQVVSTLRKRPEPVAKQAQSTPVIVFRGSTR